VKGYIYMSIMWHIQHKLIQVRQLIIDESVLSRFILFIPKNESDKPYKQRRFGIIAHLFQI